MRVINLNGYIDEEVWYGDEITLTFSMISCSQRARVTVCLSASF